MSTQEILSHFQSGARAVALHGASGSYLGLVLARLVRGAPMPRPLLVVTPDEDRAQELAKDLGF